METTEKTSRDAIAEPSMLRMHLVQIVWTAKLALVSVLIFLILVATFVGTVMAFRSESQFRSVLMSICLIIGLSLVAVIRNKYEQAHDKNH